MPSLFKFDRKKRPVAPADPGSELDYSVSSWLEGLLFIEPTDWTIEPAVPGVPYSKGINPAPVVIDQVTYQAGQIAFAWVKDLQPGIEYTVTVKGTFTGGRKDERSFILQCQQL